MSKAVFFDRDDTLIVNVPYNGDPAKVELIPGARECLVQLREAGFRLFVVSNQSGVGRGLITPEQVDAVNAEMNRQLDGDFFSGIYHCYAKPGDPGAEERKPSPALLLQAAREHDIDLRQSFMVGDRLSDVLCGRNAGCRSVYIPKGNYPDELEEGKKQADFVAQRLSEVTEWILSL